MTTHGLFGVRGALVRRMRRKLRGAAGSGTRAGGAHVGYLCVGFGGSACGLCLLMRVSVGLRGLPAGCAFTKGRGGQWEPLCQGRGKS